MTWMKIHSLKGEYFANELGEIKSTDRIIIRKNGRPYPAPGVLKKQRVDSEGYSSLVIKRKNYLAHRLVCEAFHGKSDLVVNHKNGIKTDNRPENLEWVSRADNTKHAFTSGLIKKHKKRCSPKLTLSHVIDIRSLLASGISARSLAKKYQVGLSSILKIKHGKTWRFTL